MSRDPWHMVILQVYAIVLPEFHVFYAAPGVPCLGDSSDKSCSVYLRVAFMTAFVVYSEAIIRGFLL